MVEGAADLASRFSSSSSLTPVFICLHLVPSVEDTQLVNEVVGGFSFVFSPEVFPHGWERQTYLWGLLFQCLEYLFLGPHLTMNKKILFLRGLWPRF